MSHGRRSLAELFWPRVKFTNGCWEWTGLKINKGYGRLDAYVDGKYKPVLAHRVSWELTRGPIPDGLFVCHVCDNPPCVRPDHLFVGTNSDNGRDSYLKGRASKWLYDSDCQRGAKNTLAKLTEPAVLAIRGRYAAGASGVSLAREYNVSPSTISLVVRRRVWGWLPDA